jgi:hypothetical protein
MWWSKVRSLVDAIFSLILAGDAPLSVQGERLVTCSFCTFQVVTETGKFCSACDCPQWFLSELKMKARMPDARCPLGYW